MKIYLKILEIQHKQKNKIVCALQGIKILFVDMSPLVVIIIELLNFVEFWRLKMSKKFIIFISISFALLSIVSNGEALMQSLDIKQISEAYVGQPVTFEAAGQLAQDSTINFEWAFSNNVVAVLVSRGGRSCSFTALSASPIALNLKAVREDKEIILETFLMAEVREFDVEVRLAPATMIRLWNSETRMEEPAKEFAVNQKLSYEAIISPDLKETFKYKWKTSQGVSFDLSQGSKKITIWREKPGLSSIEVEVTNKNGVLLGRGKTFDEITISNSIINESENRKKSWGKWNEALKIWDDSDFSSAEGYEKALNLALEA
jgi:hypothetical protein